MLVFIAAAQAFDPEFMPTAHDHEIDLTEWTAKADVVFRGTATCKAVNWSEQEVSQMRARDPWSHDGQYSTDHQKSVRCTFDVAQRFKGSVATPIIEFAVGEVMFRPTIRDGAEHIIWATEGTDGTLAWIDNTSMFVVKRADVAYSHTNRPLRTTESGLLTARRDSATTVPRIGPDSTIAELERHGAAIHAGALSWTEAVEAVAASAE